MAHVLGVDVSTTATKAVLVDEAGAVVGTGVAEYGYEVPRPLWSEQRPELWWDGTVAAVRSVLSSSGVAADDVVAVGLTGQMHGAVLLDRAGTPLRPAILWNDQRTAAECEAIRRAVGPERLIAITGNDALTGFTAPKLVWVRDHEPEIWGRTAQVLLPKDYVRYVLTGEYAVDKADGAGTLLFDLAARDWSPEVVGALGIDPAWLPRSWEGPEVTGGLTPAAAQATGLRAGTPVVAGAGDQAANAVGVGAVVLVVMGANVLSWIMTSEEAGAALAALFIPFDVGPGLTLVIIAMVTLALGTAMEEVTMLVLMTPILAPVVAQEGIDPIHFGIIFVLATMIGLITPPVGVSMYIACTLADISVSQFTRAVIRPFLALMTATVVLALWPDIVLFLPRIVFGD